MVPMDGFMKSGTFVVMVLLFVIPPYFLVAQACPGHVHLAVSWDQSRSSEDTECLTCTLSGIAIEEIEYYWWLIHQINTPIYTYSKVYSIDEINQKYKELVIKANHSSMTRGNFSSTLEILRREMHYKKYRCEFVLADYSICAKTIGMLQSKSFKRQAGPRISTAEPSEVHPSKLLRHQNLTKQAEQFNRPTNFTTGQSTRSQSILGLVLGIAIVVCLIVLIALHVHAAMYRKKVCEIKTREHGMPI